MLDGFTGYKLMANNNDEHFQWTSNVQLISKVYLKQHSSANCYTLNSKDKKMVSAAVQKKI